MRIQASSPFQPMQLPLLLDPSVASEHSDGLQGRILRTEDGAIDLKIGQMLCSRLCHDLIGPTAAINAGEELIREGDAHGDDDEARELIAESARQLAGRLTFFRIAFGPGGTLGGGLSYAEARALAEGFLLGGRIRLNWVPNAGDLFGDAVLQGDAVRLLLCLIMLAADALPRGGCVHVHIDADARATRLVVSAEGRAARIAGDILDALQSTEIATVTSRTVHAFYLARLASRLSAEIDIDRGATDEICINAVVPGPRQQVERRCAQ